MSNQWEIVPLTDQVDITAEATVLVPWTATGYRRVVRVACINDGAAEVDFVLYTSDCGGDVCDEADSVTVPAKSQRSLEIPNALDVQFQLMARTTVADTTSKVRCVVKGTWQSP